MFRSIVYSGAFLFMLLAAAICVATFRHYLSLDLGQRIMTKLLYANITFLGVSAVYAVSQRSWMVLYCGFFIAASAFLLWLRARLIEVASAPSSARESS